jgi:flavodoxin
MKGVTPVKSLVIYDSQYGNTRLLAEAIASELEAVGTVSVENARIDDVTLPSDLTLLVVGGPTQVHNVSPPLRGQLDTIAKHRLDGIQAAAFDTRSHGPRILTGAASVGIAKRLKRKGANLVVEAESFLVEGTEVHWSKVSWSALAPGRATLSRKWLRQPRPCRSHSGR